VLAGLRAAASVTAGYLPAAVAFGVAARQAGLSVFEAVFMAATVYSGASQFALVGLISSGAPALVAGVSALLLSLRHVLYGPALAPSLRSVRGWRVGVVAYGLTDEVFAVALGRLRQRQASFGWMVGLEAGAWVPWLSGIAAGAIAGAAIVQKVPVVAPALSFALPALFVALLVSLVPPDSGSWVSGNRRAGVGAVVAAGTAAAGFYLAGQESWGVLAAGVAGPVTGVCLKKWGTRGR